MKDETEDRDDEDEELDGEDEVEETTESTGRSGTMTFLAGMAPGALVGAGVALLMAPERGAGTRRRLKKFGSRMGKDAKDKVEDWRGDGEGEVFPAGREKRAQD